MSAFVVTRAAGAWIPLHQAHGAILIWSASLALFMTATGALDTEAANWPARIGYWTIVVAVAGAATLIAGRWREVANQATLLWACGRVAILLLPISAIALSICIAMFGGEWSLARLAALVPAVAAMLAVLQIPMVYFTPATSADPAGSVADPQDLRSLAASPLADLLPAELRSAELHALEGQDHYVRVHTSRGKVMLRMRLSDAVAAAAAVPGLQTHRSWWVAHSAVERVNRKRGRVEVLLTDGVRVPVSRSLKHHCRELI